MSPNLSPENQAYIDGQVAGGVYTSREEAIDAGVALLRKRNELVAHLKESRRQLDEGELVEYDDKTLTARFDELKAKASSRSQM